MVTENRVIQLRQDHGDDWNTNDPVLSLGELGLETNTGLVKIGDGTTVWTSLDYAFQLYDAATLKSDNTALLSAGFKGAVSDGATPGATFTPDPANGQYQKILNDGSPCEIQVPTIGTNEATDITLHIRNTGSPSGALTFAAGYETPEGDTYVTTNAAEFEAYIHALNDGTNTRTSVVLKQFV